MTRIKMASAMSSRRHGCTLIYACNYNPFGDHRDGSCDFSCVGCTDMNACNFDPLFTIEDGR